MTESYIKDNPKLNSKYEKGYGFKKIKVEYGAALYDGKFIDRKIRRSDPALHRRGQRPADREGASGRDEPGDGAGLRGRDEEHGSKEKRTQTG